MRSMSGPSTGDHVRATPPTEPDDKMRAVAGAPGNRLFAAGAALLALLAFAALLWQLRPVLLLLFAATLVAIVLGALTRLICRWVPLPRPIALALAAITLFGSIFAIAGLFGSELVSQVNQLAGLVPGGWQDLSARVGEERLNHIVEQFSPSGSNIVSIVRSILSFVSGMVSATLLAMLGGVFLASQPSTYRAGFHMILPRSWEARGEETLHELGVALRRFLLGQTVSVIFVGVTIFLGMWLIGAPSPLALAVIAAVLGFIPVIGPLMAAAPAVLIGLTMGGDAVWKIAAIYFVVQQTDGNLVNALVMRHSVKIPPAVTMFSLFSIGVIFGPAGLILGGPLTVLCFVLIRKLWIEGRLGKPVDE